MKIPKKSKAGPSIEPAPEDLTKINENTDVANIENYLFNPNDEMEPEEIIISIQGKNIGSVGNAVVITGKPKSRKSVVAHSIIGAALSGAACLGIEANLSSSDEVALIDTEQSRHDLKRSLNRMQNLVKIETFPEAFKCYSVRQLNPFKIKSVIKTISENPKVKLIVIDGGLDLILNMNDVIEAKETVDFIKKILEENKICLVMIIHQSKSTNFTIGHFGSFMDRFVQTNIEVTKLDNGNSEIKAQLMRSDDNFKPYEFYWNYNDNNYSINWVESLEVTATDPKDFDKEAHANKLRLIFTQKEILIYKDLLTKIKLEYKKSEYWAKACVVYLYEIDLLEKTNNGIKFKDILPF